MEAIKTTELEERFRRGELFKEGGIRIWKDETGRFGDPVYRIENLRAGSQGDSLVLELSNSEVIEISKPDGFFTGDNKFVVEKAEYVSWHQQGIRILKYINNGKNIVTKSAIPYKH